jgi:hypothetical protein
MLENNPNNHQIVEHRSNQMPLKDQKDKDTLAKHN